MATEEQALQQTRQFFNEAARLGITSVQDMSIPVNAERSVSLFTKAPAPIRVRLMRFLLTDSKGRIAPEGRDLPSKPAPLVTLSGTKWVLDGTHRAVERHTRALRGPA